MALSGASNDYQRKRQQGESARVEFVELFFDLVFVFAVTQLSHFLLKHLSVAGALEGLLMLVAVWWVWNYTAWVTNWLDPRKAPVRGMLFALMLAGLMLSTSIPEAFEGRGLQFALAYVVMQVGRTLFVIWALKNHNRDNYLNFVRIGLWLTLSGVFWISGGLAEPENRFALWAVALLIELVSPALGFWTPWHGASSTTGWDIEGGHMAERSALFIIIALGESILVSGVTFAELELNWVNLAAFLTTFFASVAMWLVYFNVGQELAHHKIASASDTGQIARVAYTYIPVILVAGIIVVAVSDELVLAHPLGHAEPALIWTAIGGSALYLAGNLLFKFYVVGRAPLSHIIGIAILAAMVPFAGHLSPLAIGAATTVVMVLVAVLELRGQPARHHAH
ncbi:low temperature requirement protein A [Aminobacter ciceronei]|uniref:Low temperature requirement protein LtrA n=1 Tax=Aminobacter ciceronei TaxID=150723 RepID=A0ABR6C7I2_9HYPH|nr:low temperature requirement protein A [Aminobacter ciceronei]MBA8907248.1 low temperature requirement protein LtrA [Aminobacter ciceronei]MBA9020973.1 low temperature requirement protein LtrA [Aminobacter ciceronei]WMC98689.1 low temperature requirement protein A [Aminobacter aminovorans]